MPDLLTHFGTTYALFRPLPFQIDVRFLFLGALLPDLPWIAFRVLEKLSQLDPINLFAYLVPFSTPPIVLSLAACLALLHPQPLQCFGIVGAAGSLHIGLDTLQTRLADGPVLLYPFSFRPYSLKSFWPESITSYLLVGASVVCIAWAIIVASPRTTLRWRNLSVALPLMLGICAVPLLTTDSFIAENAYTLGFASEPRQWEGKVVTLGRDPVVAPNVVEVAPSRGLRLRIMGDVELRPGERVTVRGYYSHGTIIPELIHRHRQGLRDLLSYSALFIFVAVWFDIPRRLSARKSTSLASSIANVGK